MPSAGPSPAVDPGGSGAAEPAEHDHLIDHFSGRVAQRYDEDSADMFDSGVVDPAVEVLAALAGGRGGAALEFGIGTGRIALPLAARGVRVCGIDLSNAMISRLRAKPGAQDVTVTVGDFARTTVPGVFDLVYLVFNTLGNLTSQDAQVDCFRNAARHLRPGGCFVVEIGVPDLRRLPPGQTTVPFHVSEERIGFDVYDCATQAMSSHHVRFISDTPDHTSLPFRYVWPAELDLMARIAGMQLHDRWSSWRGEPFVHESTQHVSVWQTTG